MGVIYLRMRRSPSTIAFLCRDLRISRGKTGYYVEMPKTRDKDRYREIAFALDAQTRKMIEQAVITEYGGSCGKRTR